MKRRPTPMPVRPDDAASSAAPQRPGRRAITLAGVAAVATVPAAAAAAPEPTAAHVPGLELAPARLRARWVLRRDDR